MPYNITGSVTFVGPSATIDFGQQQINNFVTNTTGDLIYANNSTTLTRLPIGTNNQILTVTLGIPGWSSSTNIGSVGTLAYSQNSPGQNYLKTNGQTLSQSAYPALYNEVGLLPSFTPTMKIMANYFNDLAYDGTYYVTVNANNSPPVVMISTDLVNWDGITNTNGPLGMSGIVWCSSLGIFAAVQNGGKIVYTSPAGGATWSASSVFPDSNLTCIAYSVTIGGGNGTILVAGGSDSPGGQTGMVIYTSTNGISWNNQISAIPAVSANAAFAADTLATPIFMIGTSAGLIQTSTNGTTWTQQTSGITASISQFATNGSMLVAVGLSGVITTCTTGTTAWTARTYQTGIGLTGVAYSSTLSKWMAVGSNIAMQSTNGTNWQVLSSNLPTTTFNAFINAGMTNGQATYYTVGSNGLIITSPDLITWTPKNLPGTPAINNFSLINIASSGSEFVIATTSSFYNSSDGTNFTPFQVVANTGLALIYAGSPFNQFMTGGSGGNIYTSTTGTGTWTSRLTTVEILCISFSAAATLAVAVGLSGHIYTSTNGTTWNTSATVVTTNLNSVAFDGTNWCAIGASSVVLTSTVGANTWTKQFPTAQQYWSNVVSLSWIISNGNGVFLMLVSAGTFLTSIDHGITWTQYSCPLNSVGSIYYDSLNTKWICYGQQGDFCTSLDATTWSYVQSGRPFTSATTSKMYNINNTFIYGPLTVGGITGIITTTDMVHFFNNTGTTSGFPDIIYDNTNNRTLALSTSNIYTSNNGGSTWGIIYNITQNSLLTGIAYSASLGMYAVVTTGSAILTSTYTNLSLWTHVPTPIMNIGTSPIIWVPQLGMFVLVGGNNGTLANPLIMTSTNGTNWLSTNIGLTGSQNFTAITYNASLGLLCSVGGNSYIVTSPDGINWTVIKPTMSVTYIGVSTNPIGGFIAMSSGSVFYTSTNGTNWLISGNNSFTNQTSSSLTYSPDLNLVLLGGANNSSSSLPYLYYTNDGINIQQFLAPATISSTNIVGQIYDVSHDVIIGGSQSSNQPQIILYNRTYNKNTQFVLPNLLNQWIKAI